MDYVEERFLPFVRSDVKLSGLELLKTCLIGIVVVPIKCTVFILWFLSLWVSCYAIYALSMFCNTLVLYLPTNALPRRFVKLLKVRVHVLFKFLLTLIIQIHCRVVLRIHGFHLKVNGSPCYYNKDGEKVVNLVVCNHINMFDGIIFQATSPEAGGVVANDAVRKLFVVGNVLSMLNSIFISKDKNNNMKKKKSNTSSSSLIDGDAEYVNATSTSPIIANRIKKYQDGPLWIFPEGTTTNGKYLLKFRSGFAVSGQPVLPCFVQYHGNSKYFSLGWESIYTVEYLVKLWTRRSKLICEFTYLSPYFPSEAEKNDPKLYAENVQNLIAHHLEVPVSQSSYWDKLDYHAILISKGLA